MVAKFANIASGATRWSRAGASPFNYEESSGGQIIKKSMWRHLVAKFVTTASCTIWSSRFVTCITILSWIVLLALLVGIEFVSSSAKFQQGNSVSWRELDP